MTYALYTIAALWVATGAFFAYMERDNGPEEMLKSFLYAFPASVATILLFVVYALTDLIRRL